MASATGLDTSVLLCLAGRWAGSSPLICWNPVRTVTDPRLIADLPAVTGHVAGAVGGGWFGWSSYSGPSWFGLFEQVLRRGPDGDWWLESIADRPSWHLGEQAGAIERLAAGQRATPPPTVRITGLSGTSRASQLAAVERAITAIRAGQLFQVNVCARFSGTLAGSPVELFAAGLRRLAPDYAAFVRTPDRTVVSFSPELFLRRDGEQVLTAPVKGTRRRLGAATWDGSAASFDGSAAASDGPDSETDRAMAAELRHSAKDRAENVMIVDLMRNDLSRVCRIGSIGTPRLLDVRPAPGVWHLVSQVTGRLLSDATTGQLLAACFPPGSVTGAPKIRAQQLIEELETVPRGVFTGAIGYLSPLPGPASAPAGSPAVQSGRAEFSVAIRTFEVTGDRFELGVGGGITADSVPMQEWQECLVKVAPLLALGTQRSDGPHGSDGPDDTGGSDGAGRPVPPPAVVRVGDGLIETMLAVDGRIVARADHLARMAASCLELYRLDLPSDLPRRLSEAVTATTGRQRVRLRAGPGRPVTIEVAPAPHDADPIALIRRLGRTGSWRHKWADREWLTAQEQGGGWPLFTEAGPDGTELVLETSRGNVAVVDADGVLRTPELGESVLPGITRRRLLDAAFDRGRRVELGPVRVADLHLARLVLSLSSLRGVAAVDSLDGVRLHNDPGLLAEIGGWLVQGPGLA